MARLTVDTNEDSLEDLQHALDMIQRTISRRGNTTAAEMVAAHAPSAQELVEEEEMALEIPGFKLTIKDASAAPNTPTINELLSDESISEEDLQELYKHVPEAQGDLRKHNETESNEELDILKPEQSENDSFIEIVEFDEEEKD